MVLKTKEENRSNAQDKPLCLRVELVHLFPLVVQKLFSLIITEFTKCKSNSEVEVPPTKTPDGNFSDVEEEQPSYIDKLEMFLNNRYNFRYNKVLGKLEFKTLKATKWKPMTDFSENSILREILKAKVKCSINSLRNLLHSDYCEMFDPFEVYFENLSSVSKAFPLVRCDNRFMASITSYKGA